MRRDRWTWTGALVGAVSIAVTSAVGAGAASGASVWPTADGPQGTGQQLAADGPLHPGVRWSVEESTTDGWHPDQLGFVLLDGAGHVLFTAEGPSSQPGLVALDTQNGAFAWASEELGIDPRNDCVPVVATDGTIWGEGDVPSRFDSSTDSYEILQALDPATGAVTRSWRPAGNLQCHEATLTAEGTLVAWVTETDASFGAATYYVGIDPLTGNELWRYDGDGCTVGELRAAAPASGPADTIYLDVFCAATNEYRLVALNTSSGTEGDSRDRDLANGRFDLAYAGATTLLGYENSDSGQGRWMVGISADTLDVVWRHRIEGPEDTSGGEPQPGPCTYQVCSFGRILGAVGSTVVGYGGVLENGARTDGVGRLDLTDGSVSWTRSIDALGAYPAHDVLSTDRSGRLWFVPTDDSFDPDNDYQKVVSISATGQLSSDTDGDGIVEYGLGAPRYYSLVPGYSGGSDSSDHDGDGKPDYAPAVTTYYAGAPDASGNLYGTAGVFFSNGSNPAYFFSIGDVPPGDDRHDGGGAGDGGGGTGGGGSGDGATVTRHAGEDRYETAGLTVSAHYATGVPHVYVATGTNFPDALAAAALAGRDGGAVLSVTRDVVPPSIVSALEYLEPGAITVVGGPAVVSNAVLEELRRYTSGSVDRIYGQNRFDTAAQLARRFSGQPDVFVATGTNFPDALAGTVPAIVAAGPILLVERDHIPAETAAALSALDPRSITILGGDAAVSRTVEQQLAGYTGGVVGRLAGQDRYATAVRIAQQVPAGSSRVYVATALNFPDALAGGAPAGLDAAPLLLVPPFGEVPQVVLDEVQRIAPSELVVLGGYGAVSPDVVDQLLARL